MSSDSLSPLSLMKRFNQTCSNCHLSKLCLPVGLDKKDLKQLDQLVTRQMVIKKGQILFRNGDKFERLIVVRSGAFKTFIIEAEDKQNILSFYLPSELFGFDGIALTQHQVWAQAIETSSICEIPFNQLLSFLTKIPSLQRQLLSIMSEKTLPNAALRLNSSAEQRLAFFLLSLSERFKNQGHSEIEFNLPMSRADIANYLGLTPETISRLFNQLQAGHILSIDKRHVTLHNLNYLQFLHNVKH